MQLLRAFRHRDFTLLWLARSISRVGDGVHTVALAWLVLELTGSAAAMGVVLAADLIPMLCLLLIGGALVDRLPKLAIMAGADVIRGVAVALVAGLIATGSVGLEHLVVLAVISGAADALFSPAYAAVVPELVPPEDRPSANALGALGSRLALIVGPAIGAVLVASGGTGAAFVVNAVSFVSSGALLVIPIVARRRARRATATHAPVATDRLADEQGAPAEQRGTSLVDDVRVGFRTVVETPWIGLTIAVAGLTTVTLAGPLEAALPLLVAEHFNGEVGVLGLIGSLTAAGSVVVAIVMGSRGRLRRRAHLIYGPWVLLALASVALGLPIGVVGVAIAGFVIGACEAALGLAWMNALQDHVPEDRLGRVYSVDALGSYALLPVGFLTAGIASDAIGPGAVFVAGGLFSAVLLAAVWALPAVRALD